MTRALALAFVVACGGSPAAPSTVVNRTVPYEPVVELQQIKTALCSCHQDTPEVDDTCVTEPADRFNAWRAANIAWFAALPEPKHTYVATVIDDARRCFQIMEGDPLPPRRSSP